MQIYMDVCCLNRPFDDLSGQARIGIEAEAVLSILRQCSESDDCILVGSDVIDSELLRMNDWEKLIKVYRLYSCAKKYLRVTPEIILRAKEIQCHGIKAFDSLHLALADACDIDLFLSTDYKLLNLAKSIKFAFFIANPAEWVRENGL